MTTNFLRSILLLAVAFLSGCGVTQRPDGFPAVYDCRVDVQNAGAPLAGAEVSLTRADGQSFYAIYGHTNSVGSAFPVTVQGTYSQKGVPEGEYVVTIQKRPELEFGKTSKELAEMSDAELDAWNADYARRLAAIPRVVPEVLEKPETSPLRVQVGSTAATLAVDIAEYAR